MRIRVDDSFDMREYGFDDVRRPGPGDGVAEREVPKPQERRPRRPQNAETEESAGDESEDAAKKKHYPHQKAPKNMSTDQFFEKLRENGGATPIGRGEHRRRKGRGGRPEGAEDAFEETAQAEPADAVEATAQAEPADAIEATAQTEPADTVEAPAPTQETGPVVPERETASADGEQTKD